MKRSRFLNALVVLLLTLALFGPAARQVEAGGGGVVFTVTLVNEGHDANPGNGVCAIATGSCTLRAAIEEANALAGVNTINFNLPGGGIHSISITSGPLPQISETLILDGTSQPNCAAPCIVLSGANLSGLNVGLMLASDFNIVKGFIITSWENYGIIIVGNGNIVQTNDIGFWPGNPTPLPNGSGISILGSNNLIGGSGAAVRNVISGNLSHGIVLANGCCLVTSGNKIQGNYIGTNADGNAALGNGESGIAVFENATNTMIGGATAGTRNVISGNGFRGIDSYGVNTSIRGNFIGVNAAGNGGLGNTLGGIRVGYGNAVIGGGAMAASNVIAYNNGGGDNGGGGVVIFGNDTRANVRRNSFYSNNGLGINLGGDIVTPNDSLDADTGPNGLQNFPVLTSATSATRVLEGRLNSKANATYTLDFYSSPTCDSSHYGEGRIYLGFLTVTTNGSGVASFSATVTGSFAVGSRITATATDSAGNTSEFSACRVAG